MTTQNAKRAIEQSERSGEPGAAGNPTPLDAPEKSDNEGKDARAAVPRERKGLTQGLPNAPCGDGVAAEETGSDDRRARTRTRWALPEPDSSARTRRSVPSWQHDPSFRFLLGPSSEVPDDEVLRKSLDAKYNEDPRQVRMKGVGQPVRRVGRRRAGTR